MGMGAALAAAIALAVLNSVLLVALCAVWVRNYRVFQSNLTLGLLTFGVVLLVENLVAVAFFFGMGTLYSNGALVGQTVLVLHTLEFVALGVLTYVTMQ